MKPMTLQQLDRHRRLLPNNYPRYVRVYDNGGETADRYTVIFTGRYNNIGNKPRSEFQYWHMCMSDDPFNGVCQLEANDQQIEESDRPTWPIPVKMGAKGDLGKRVQWHDLPELCKKAALHVYKELWDLYPAEQRNAKIQLPRIEDC